MEELSVPACACEPRLDGGVTVAEDPFGSGRIQPSDPRRQEYGNLVGGGFQTIQWGMASGSEGGVASLTAKGLDALGLTMLAIPDQRMDVSIGDPEVGALRVGTGEARGVHALGGSPAAFHLAPGAHRCRLTTRRSNGGMAHAMRNEIVSSEKRGRRKAKEQKPLRAHTFWVRMPTRRASVKEQE